MNSISTTKNQLNIKTIKDNFYNSYDSDEENNNENPLSDSQKKEIILEKKEQFLKDIEEILISVYNYHIININSRNSKKIKICDIKNNKGISPKFEFEKGKNLITKLSEKLGIFYNAFAQRVLSIKIKQLIERNKKNLFQNENIKKLFYIYKSEYNKSKKSKMSLNKYNINNNNYIHKNKIRNFSNLNHSKDILDNELIILFNQLRNFKRSLIESVDDIKIIFNAPLSGFQPMNIHQKQLDIYKEIFLNDNFIKYFLDKYRYYCNYYLIIREIEDKFINFYKIIKKKIKFDIPKKIIKNEIQQVPNDIDSLYNYIIDDTIEKTNDKKSKRKKKKNKKNNINSDTIDDNNNTINITESEDLKFKNNILKNTEYIFECHKLKCKCSEDWINKLKNNLKDCKTFN